MTLNDRHPHRRIILNYRENKCIVAMKKHRGVHKDLLHQTQNTNSFTEKNFWVQLTFALSLTGLLSHLGSNICKTQDQRHSDTTPLFTGHGENFQGEKPSL